MYVQMVLDSYSISLYDLFSYIVVGARDKEKCASFR